MCRFTGAGGVVRKGVVTSGAKFALLDLNLDAAYTVVDNIMEEGVLH